MAKKKQALSPEERLAAALVPEEEWPYALPNGWKWVYWGKCGDFIAGTGFPKLYQGIIGEKYPFYKVGSLRSIDADGYLMDNQHSIDDKILLKIKAKKIEPNSIVFAKIGEAIKLNRRGLTKQVCCVDNNMMAFQADKNLLDYHYVYYWSTGIDLYKYTNATTVPAIRKTDLEKIVFPLPPLSEQHRLVARIESLFAKLDAAKEKVQSVLDSHETRKAALLHDAFTGKLTAKWREERGIPQSWKNGKLLDCLLEKPRNGYSPKAVNYPTKCKSMSLSATTDGIFKKEYYKYIDEEIPADSYLWLEPGDILIQRSNSLEKVGISAIYTGGTHEYIYPDLMMKLQVNNQNDPAYINYFLQRAETRAYFLSNATGIAGNMPKINQKTVSNTPVNYPSLTEQQEIVRILGRLLAREQRARQTAEETLTAIERMKQAILARAFRGEL